MSSLLDAQSYEFREADLPAQLRQRFVQLGADDAALDFVRRARARSAGPWRTRTQRLLRLFLSDFNANALLGLYPMHLLSTDQARRLLAGLSPRSLLDVGAGSGDITRQLAPIFSEVTTTETASFAARRLRRAGLACVRTDLADGQGLGRTFDVVACLNVLDRTLHPGPLLDACIHALAPGGALLLSVPLPYRPAAYRGPEIVDPEAPLRITASRFAAAFEQLVHLELEPRRLEIERFTRVPYLSGGDAVQALYVLDCIVVVARRPAARSSFTAT